MKNAIDQELFQPRAGDDTILGVVLACRKPASFVQFQINIEN